MKSRLAQKIMKHRKAFQIWSLFNDSVDPKHVALVRRVMHKKNIYWLVAWARCRYSPYKKDHRLTKAVCLDDKRWGKIAKFTFNYLNK